MKPVWFFEDQYGFQSWSENTGTCWSSKPISKRRREDREQPAWPERPQLHDLCDLTLGRVSLHEEAEPVVHVVVFHVTPEGVTEAGRRAKSPVARLLPETKPNVFMFVLVMVQRYFYQTSATSPGSAGRSRVWAALSASQPTEETRRRL